MTLGRPGDLLADRYRLDRFVSGAGAVERWRAYDERLARPVTARLEPVTDAAEQDEATAAAQAALASVARLNHPGVAAVYDMGTADELHGSPVGYAISEWTDGRTLGQIMATGPQSWPRTADWGKQISGALAALHEIGVAHGSLSPESVAVHDDRQVKILDVGLEGAEAGQNAKTSDQFAQDLPAGAPDDVYALGFLLWEATVGAAPEYVISGADTGSGEGGGPEAADKTAADAEADTQDTEPQKPAEGAGAATAATASRLGIDQQPLLDTGAPAELAALLTQMLAADPALRPTAAEAERRFAPFASAERVGDTLAGIAAVSAQTEVIGPPVAGAGAGAAAAAAEAARAERDRRRGALLGLVLLVAAVLAGLGFVLVDLNSHSGSPAEVNTVIPSSSPGMVTLPNGSLSPAPTRTTTGGGQQTTFAPSTPASSATASQAPTSSPSGAPSSSASAPATPTSSSSPSSAGGGAPSSPAGPGGGTPSAAPTGHVSPLATTLN